LLRTVLVSRIVLLSPIRAAAESAGLCVPPYELLLALVSVAAPAAWPFCPPFGEHAWPAATATVSSAAIVIRCVIALVLILSGVNCLSCGSDTAGPRS
jgi:hypothetical protein